MRKMAVVTGASSGIGAEFARQLAGQGHNLLLVARREERLAAKAVELRAAHNVSVAYLAADLACEDGVSAVQQAIGDMPELTMLVNNAGFGLSGPLAGAELPAQTDMLRLHVVAPMRLTHAALGRMVTQGSGAIINVASLAAFIPLPSNANYSATKAYLVSFSQAVASEVRRYGVRVQALCPGFTMTEFHEQHGRPPLPGFLWGPVDAVVSDSLRAITRGQVVCIPGGINRAIRLLARTGLVNRLAPRFLGY